MKAIEVTVHTVYSDSTNGWLNGVDERGSILSRVYCNPRSPDSVTAALRDLLGQKGADRRTMHPGSWPKTSGYGL